jgi:16S rRNA (adenine1518-N6/adenine1519-N6)-dimethyltransferase
MLAAHDLRAKKQLGQNFLSDPSTAQMIMRRAELAHGEVVLEIGAGLGALTLPLALVARRVFAVEKDGALARLLQGELQAAGVTNVDVIEADALSLDIAALCGPAGRLVVFGNLPYNISSQVVVKLIEARHCISRAVLMFQKELAERLLARPGGKDYGRITAMLQYCAQVRLLAEVGAKSFFPSPKVDSAVLEIAFPAHPAHPARDEALLFRLIAAAFGKRRKTLKNALSASALGLRADEAAALLARAGIDPARRAETLAPDEFVALEACFRQPGGGGLGE